MKNKFRLGIVGFGSIGKYIAVSCEKKLKGRIKITAVFDTVPGPAASYFKRKPSVIANNLSDVFKRSDLVVESAGKSAVKSVLEHALKYRKDVMIMSVGGLLGLSSTLKRSASRGIKVYVPSGAVSGIDALKSAMSGKVRGVCITTTKPAMSLEGAPYIIKKGIDLSRIRGERTIFEGNAVQAVDAFPKNINVSALLSLAGIGPGRTRVRIVASEKAKKNIHRIQIDGEFGIITTVTENVPFPENPKTSFLAALSAVAVLKGITDNVKIGT